MDAIELLVVGGSGFVGREVESLATVRGVAGTWFRTRPAEGAAPVPRFPLDVTDATAVADLVAHVAPRVIVNATVASRADDAPEVTTRGAAHVAAAAQAHGAMLLYLSTDMVFDGDRGPYDEDAPPSPITPYGEAKATAESLVRAACPGAVIARLPLLFSVDPPDPALARFLAQCRAGAGHPLFVDELRCPAHVRDIAAAIVLLARALAGAPSLPPPPPVVHLPGPRVLSRHQLGRLLLGALGLPLEWARPGRAADAQPRRPRELVLLTPRTPAVYLLPLRAPEDVLGAAPLTAAPTTPPTPPAGR